MAGEKVIQLHKAEDTSTKWFPITYTSCVKYNTLGETGTVSNPFEFSPNESLNHCFEDIHTKTQPKLIGTQTEGQNIKTINGNSILGSGNLVIQSGGGSGTVSNGNAGRLAFYQDAGTTIKECSTEGGTASSRGLNWDKQYGRLGVDKTSPDCALDVNGNIYASGGISCAASSSDIRLKTDVKPFKGLDIVNSMDYVQFKWNDVAVGLNSDDEKYFDKESNNYGVIAQDVDGVIDGLVFDMPNGYKGVKYEKLIPIMAQAIKELSAEVEELRKRIKD